MSEQFIKGVLAGIAIASAFAVILTLMFTLGGVHQRSVSVEQKGFVTALGIRYTCEPEGLE